MELCEKYRPKDLENVVGQDKAVSILKGILNKPTKKMPHTLIFTGNSGCGKTTLARIFAKRLKVSSMDLVEINTADFGGIDMVREIRTNMNKFPMQGTYRAWIIDEAHSLSREAQAAFLKILEEPPAHCFFLLATTDPVKLIEPLLQRCTKVKVDPVSDVDLKTLITKIAKKEKIDLSKKITRLLISTANGSPRNALKYLDAVSSQRTEEEREYCLISSDTQTQAFGIFKAMMDFTPWTKLREVVKNVKEEPEVVRRIILACVNTTVLTGEGNRLARAFDIGKYFMDNWYDCGKAGLSLACMEVCNLKR
jgi:DNA polymerase III gamma/tau subunit